MPLDFATIAEPIPQAVTPTALPQPGAGMDFAAVAEPHPGGAGFDFSRVAEPIQDPESGARAYAHDRLTEVRASREARGLPPLPMIADPSRGPISEADLLDNFKRAYRGASGQQLPDVTTVPDPTANIAPLQRVLLRTLAPIDAGISGAIATGDKLVGAGNADARMQEAQQSQDLVNALAQNSSGTVEDLSTGLAPWVGAPMLAALSTGGNRAVNVQDRGGSPLVGAAAGTAEGVASLLVPKALAMGIPAARIQAALIGRFGAPAAAEILAQVPTHVATGAALPAASAAVSAATGDTERAKAELASIPESALLMGALGTAAHAVPTLANAASEANQTRQLMRDFNPATDGAGPRPSQQDALARAAMDPANAQQQAPASGPVDVQRALDLRQQQTPGVDPATIRAQQEVDATTKATAEQTLAEQQQATAAKVQRDQEQAAQATAKAEADARMATARAKAVADQVAEQAKATDEARRAALPDQAAAEASANEARLADEAAAAQQEHLGGAAAERLAILDENRTALRKQLDETDGRLADAKASPALSSETKAARQQTHEAELQAGLGSRMGTGEHEGMVIDPHGVARSYDKGLAATKDYRQELGRRLRADAHGDRAQKVARTTSIGSMKAERERLKTDLAKADAEHADLTASEQRGQKIAQQRETARVKAEQQAARRGQAEPTPVDESLDVPSIPTRLPPREQPVVTPDPEGVKRGPQPLTPEDLAALPESDRATYLRDAKFQKGEIVRRYDPATKSFVEPEAHPLGRRPSMPDVARAIREHAANPDPAVIARAKARFDDWQAGHTTIDRTKDVPLAGGISKDGKTVYVDRQMPKTLTMRDGTVVDVAKATAAHEVAERTAMDAGKSYPKAHDQNANPAENRYLRSLGVDPKEYNAALKPHLDAIAAREKAKVATGKPQNLAGDMHPKQAAATANEGLSAPRLRADQFKTAIESLPISRRTPGHADAIMALVDARARAVGKTTDQWIGDRISGVKTTMAEPSLNQDVLDQNGRHMSVDDIVKGWKERGISAHVHESPSAIELSKIVVPSESRGAGIGTAAMRELTDYADRVGKRIELTPSADFGGSKSRLVEFYKRLGFTENKGRSRDFTTRAGMIREPEIRSLDQSVHPAGKSLAFPDLLRQWRKANGDRTPVKGGEEWQQLQREAAEIDAKRGVSVLDQGDTLHDARVVRRGAAEFAADSRAIIHAFEQADASTTVHELGHVFRRDLSDVEQATAGKAFGAKLVDGAWKWSRGAEERFARGFERYLRDGNAPTEELKSVFAKFKDWLHEVYKAVTGSAIDVKISPEMRGVFDRMFQPGQDSAPVKESSDAMVSVPERAPGERAAPAGPGPDRAAGGVRGDVGVERKSAEAPPAAEPVAKPTDLPLGTKNNRPDLATPGEDAATRKAFVRERNKMEDPEHQTREEVRQRAKEAVTKDPEAAFNKLTEMHTKGQALNVEQIAQAQHLLDYLRKNKRTADFQRMATIYQVAGTEGARALGYRADLMQSPEGRLAEARSLAAMPRPERAKQIDTLHQQVEELQKRADILFQKDPDTARKMTNRIAGLQKKIEKLEAQAAEVYAKDKEHLKELGFDLDGDTSKWAYDPEQWKGFQGALDATRGGMPAVAREIYTGMLHMSGMVAGKKIVADTIGIPFGVLRRHIEAGVAGAKRLAGHGSDSEASAGELAAMWHSMLPALSRAARNGWDTFKTERIPKELMGDEDLMHYPALRGVKGKIFRHAALFGTVRSIDSFSRSLVAHLEANAQAYRSAVDAGGKRLEGEALADHLHKEVNDYTSESWEKAREAAMQATFTERPMEIVRTINRLKYDKAASVTRKGIKFAANVMLPFSTIPANIAKQGLLNWTPGLSEAGIIARAMHRRASTGEWGYDPNKFNHETAQAVIRWSSALALMSLAKSGMITGSDDKNNPDSISLFGHHFSYKNLGPVARVIAAASDWAAPVKPSKEEKNPETAKASTERMLHGAWDQFSEMPLIRAAADLVRAASYDDGWRRFAADKAGSLVEPSIAHQAMTAQQDDIRAKAKVKGDGLDRFLGYLKDRVTTNSGKPVKVDGHPLVKDRFDSDVGTFLWRMASPFTLGTRDAGK